MVPVCRPVAEERGLIICLKVHFLPESGLKWGFIFMRGLGPKGPLFGSAPRKSSLATGLPV